MASHVLTKPGSVDTDTVEDHKYRYVWRKTYKVTFDHHGGRKLQWFTEKADKTFDGPSLSYDTCPGALIQTTGAKIKIQLTGSNNLLI